MPSMVGPRRARAQYRVISVTARPHIDDDIRQWMGDARARWEGDTLVVTTTNFNDKGMIASSGGGGRMKGIPVSRWHCQLNESGPE